MSRNWGIMNGPASLGGVSADRPATRDEILPRDLELLFPGSTTFKRGYLAQALIDVLTVSVWMFLGCAAVVIVGGPLLALCWMLFFG